MGIRQKSIVSHLVASFIPLLLLAGISFVTVSNVLRSITTDALIATSQEAMSEIQTHLAETVLDVTAWAHLASMQDVLMDDHWGAIGREAVQLKERYEQIATITVTNEDGVVVASSDERLNGINISDEPAFQTTKSGRLFQKWMAQSRFSARPGVVVAVAIRASYASSVKIGTLVAVIDWGAIGERLRALSIIGQPQDHGRRLVLADTASGEILYDGDQTHPIPRLPAAGSLLGQVAEVHAEGSSFLAGMAMSHPTGLMNDPGWSLYALVEVSLAYAMVNDFRDTTLALFATQALLVLVLGYFAAGHLTRPIEAVTRALERVAAGNLEPMAVDQHRTDEIGSMVKALEVFRENLTRMHWLTLEKARIAARGRMIMAEAFEALAQPVSVWDAADTFVFGNPAFDRLVASLNRPKPSVGDAFADLRERLIESVPATRGDGTRLAAAWDEMETSGGGLLTLSLADGRTFRLVERRTTDGSRVTSLVDITEFRHREDALALLTQEDRLDPNFAAVAAEALGKALGFPWAGVTRWDLKAGTARIIALQDRSAAEIGHEIPLSGTPCAVARETLDLCALGQATAQRFPEDAWLGRLGIEAYVGAPYFDHSGRPIGHVFAMSDAPAEFSEESLQLVRMVARWVEANHERAEAEEQLRRMNEGLEQLVAERTRELRHANAGLEEARQRMTDAIESISESFVLWDAEDRLVLCNSHYRENYSVIRDMLVPGVPFADVVRAAAEYQHPIPEEDRAEWMAKRIALHRQADSPHEQTMVDGRTFLVSERRTSDGGTVSVSTDITRLKLMQSQLVQTSKLATLGEMATGIAHEINQPLTVMRMAAEKALKFIERDSPDRLDRVADKLTRVMSQIDRARSITDHMRTFGRKGSDRPERMTLKSVADSALALIGEQLTNHGIDVSLMADRPALVLGNQIQLEQVVVNLLANARDAIEGRSAREGREAPRTIAVRVGTEGEHAIIDIEDSGGGIDARVIDRIFDPFFTTKEAGKGTGLGLSISYGIVTSMGGTLRAENRGQGARFTVSLPLITTSHEEA
ncbi:MAG: PAS-domain containing protein [Alphaproteobacteria bacterium]